MVAQYVHRIQPIREGFLLDSSPEEDRIVAEHFHDLERLSKDGTVLLAGWTLNTDPSSFGIVIFEAESEEPAHRLVQSNPAVKASGFRAELFPFRIALVARDVLSN